LSKSNVMKPVEILLIEDNPGDVRLTKEALKKSKIKINLNVVRDGVKAMDYLCKHGKYKSKPKPNLILLDLNLPKKDGREVLADIKDSDSLKMIPIVILTTSLAENDILSSYNQHANCYINKPVELNKFFKVIRSIELFWFGIVKLPPNRLISK